MMMEIKAKNEMNSDIYVKYVTLSKTVGPSVTDGLAESKPAEDSCRGVASQQEPSVGFDSASADGFCDFYALKFKSNKSPLDPDQ